MSLKELATKPDSCNLSPVKYFSEDVGRYGNHSVQEGGVFLCECSHQLSPRVDQSLDPALARSSPLEGQIDDVSIEGVASLRPLNVLRGCGHPSDPVG